jgi:hypothetical protein
MDGSFLAFRQILHRILVGHKVPRDDPKAAGRHPDPRELPDDWARIEL